MKETDRRPKQRTDQVDTSDNRGDMARELGITPRLREIINCMAKGLSKEQTAQMMKIPLETVKSHATRLYKRLGVRTGVEAILIAVDLGIVDELILEQYSRSVDIDILTKKEKVVMEELTRDSGSDSSLQGIAVRLSISRRTVQRHLVSIYDKLDAANNVQAAVMYVRTRERL